MKLRRATFNVPRGCFAISQKFASCLIFQVRISFWDRKNLRRFKFSHFPDKFRVEVLLLGKFCIISNFLHHFSHLSQLNQKLNNLIPQPWKWLMMLNIEKFYQTWNFCTKKRRKLSCSSFLKLQNSRETFDDNACE